VRLGRHHIAAALLITAVACGGKDGGPTQPAPLAPVIACPADLAIREVRTAPQPVHYGAPSVSGGASPLTTICSPESGTAFSWGTTPVQCTATDGLSRRASCSFGVTLTGFAVGITNYLAVGDSLTEGENGLPAPSFVDTLNAYSTKLKALFDSEFPAQNVTIVNRGAGGERLERTLALLPKYLLEERPQAVLLLTGYNNLDPCDPGAANSTACKAAITDVEFGVRDSIREVKESPLGIKFMFVSTITPSGPLAPGSRRDLRLDPNAVVEVNARIRHRVAVEGMTLVDTYTRFLGHEAEYTSIDGVHLTPAGYEAVAETFFASIKATVAQTPLLHAHR
jgi:lysophospholipase L1-like esterase